MLCCATESQQYTDDRFVLLYGKDQLPMISSESSVPYGFVA